MKTLLEIVGAVGSKDHDIEAWILKLELRSRIAEVARGAKRLYSRDNVLELAFLAALVKCGITPAFAGDYAGQIYSAAINKKGFADWIIFPAGQHPIVDDGKRASIAFSPSVTQAKIIETSKQSATAGVSIINTGEIVRRVDQLFAEM